MNESARHVSMMKGPTTAEAHNAVERARRMFHRVLGAWVGDLLCLRREGLHTPAWTDDAAAWRYHEAA